MNDLPNKYHPLFQTIGSTINRRTFIKNMLISATSLAMTGCGGGSSSSNGANESIPEPEELSFIPGDLLSKDRTTQSIIIIGAGISGLVAGYELSISGHEVIFLEARDRTGGRINTLQAPFLDGQFAEAGASRIPSNHTLTLGYINHFGLLLDLFYPTSGSYFKLNNRQTELINATDYIAMPPWPGSVNRNTYRKIAGGMSELPNAFTNYLSSQIHYSKPVKIIKQNNDGVEITTDDGDIHLADRVLCTVPLPVLNKIQFVPELSDEKNLASNGGYHYSDSSRLYSQFSEHFWLNNNLNGWGETDYPEEIWQPTWAESGSKGILQSYFRGTPAEQFDALNKEQQIVDVHNRWRSVFPNLDDYLLDTSTFTWADEIWSGSGYASPTQSQEATLKQHLSAVEGRIHFSGEHTSNFPGWIQGALESGISVAQEIHLSN